MTMETWPYTTHHPLDNLAETVPLDMATFLHIPTNKKKKKRGKGRSIVIYQFHVHNPTKRKK